MKQRLQRFKSLKTIGYQKLKTKEEKEEFSLLKKYFEDAGIDPMKFDASVLTEAPKIEITPETINITGAVAEEPKDVFTQIKEQKKDKLEIKPSAGKFEALPPPVKDHLMKTFGNWLNYFEVGQEYKKSYGGYGMYIKIPKEFSTEYKTEKVMAYDNRTQSAKKDEEGNTIMNTVVTPDIRWCPLGNPARTVGWITQVKYHLMKNAADKGLRLPDTQTAYEPDKKLTREEFIKSIHN